MYVCIAYIYIYNSVIVYMIAGVNLNTLLLTLHFNKTEAII